MDEVRALIAGATVGMLATVRPDGRPHVVPMVFALVGDAVVTAIDWKPKGGRRLQRLVNIDANPEVSFLVHHYDEDWSRLWWARIDGSAGIHESGERWSAAIAALVDKYVQYQERPPEGQVIWIDPSFTATWHGTG